MLVKPETIILRCPPLRCSSWAPRWNPFEKINWWQCQLWPPIVVDFPSRFLLEDSSSLDKPVLLLFSRFPPPPLFPSFLSNDFLLSTGQPLFSCTSRDRHVKVTAFGSCSMHAAGTSGRAGGATWRTARMQQGRYLLLQLQRQRRAKCTPPNTTREEGAIACIAVQTLLSAFLSSPEWSP